MEVIIYGQCPSQKNGKQIFTNKSTGKPFISSSNIVKEWQKSAAEQLAVGFRGCADGKVTVAYTFYVKDRRRRDLDNMIATVNDALVKAGLLKDDSWQCLAIGAADAELDIKNPRVELWIDEP